MPYSVRSSRSQLSLLNLQAELPAKLRGSGRSKSGWRNALIRAPASFGIDEGHPNRADKRPNDVIRGSSNPELLMPSEIFTTFMRVAYAYEDGTAREFRRDALNKALALGLPQDFLDTVERESEAFLRLQRRSSNFRSGYRVADRIHRRL